MISLVGCICPSEAEDTGHKSKHCTGTVRCSKPRVPCGVGSPRSADMPVIHAFYVTLLPKWDTAGPVFATQSASMYIPIISVCVCVAEYMLCSSVFSWGHQSIRIFFILACNMAETRNFTRSQCMDCTIITAPLKISNKAKVSTSTNTSKFKMPVVY